MTAIRDRQSDPDADDVPVPWDERPLVGARRGLPWWGAVLVCLGLAVVSAFVAKKATGDLGILFQVCYVVGAVAAVVVVQRRALFGPMVQPPLVLAVTVPVVVLLTSGSENGGGDMFSRIFNIGQPLINSFPVMAIATVLTLALGFFRIYRERDPNAPIAVKGKAKPERRRGDDEERPPSRAAAAGRPRPPGSRTGQTPLPPDARRGAGRDGEPPRRPRPPVEGGGRAPRGGREPLDREPGTRAARTPPPGGARQPRAPRPMDGEPPRRREPRGGEPPRRRIPREDPRGGDAPPPRRTQGRPQPRRPRPWDDER
ncbi:DUF6542 domain-containing protein [Amycolatopsis sp. NPDC059021]|uniref:DUF6542 domain-containing protein n=1 Tax=Amycolatopsis sp. NPDC059021 TaxID=3346704 RepID=UPI003672C142